MDAAGSKNRPLRVAFITSTPLNVREGSGTFVAIQTLADALRCLGATVDLVAPKRHLPVQTVERLVFNAGLRIRRWDHYDVTVGFDMDGYRIAGRTARPHLASVKGVIADEMQYERGWTRVTMAVQARPMSAGSRSFAFAGSIRGNAWTCCCARRRNSSRAFPGSR
jgi:hypothetical protein